MTKSICSLEFDDLCKQLDKFADDTERMLAFTFNAMMQNNGKNLRKSDELAREIEQTAKILTQLVLASTKSTSPGQWEPTIILEVVYNIQQIKYSVEKINNSIQNKIDDSVLFSDKAMTELRDIFGVAADCLHHVHDLMLTKNDVLVEHIVQRTSAYEEVISKYTDEHEDRLVKGICLPRSSLLYLLIVDSLKDILWYAKTMAKKFRE